MSERPKYRRVITVEAMLVGGLFAFVIGFIVGLAAALVTSSVGVGAFVWGVMFLFSLDVMFRGTDT